MEYLRVVSSTKLLKHTLSAKWNMSLIYMSNIRGASLDPCGTPEKISFHRLKLLFTFVIKRTFGESVSFKFYD